MAKDEKLGGLLSGRKAEPGSNTADNSDLDDGLLKATGLGLREGEIAAIAEIAARHELSANAVKRLAVRYFIVKYRAGEIDLDNLIEEPPPPKKKISYSSVTAD
jgi:hypothetical protein